MRLSVSLKTLRTAAIAPTRRRARDSGGRQSRAGAAAGAQGSSPAAPGVRATSASQASLQATAAPTPYAAAPAAIPRRRQIPGGETIDTAACFAPPRAPATPASPGGAGAREPARDSDQARPDWKPPRLWSPARSIPRGTRGPATSHAVTTTPVVPRDPTNGGWRRVRGAALARLFE